jgi:hypothetical protein
MAVENDRAALVCYQGYDPYGHGKASLEPVRCAEGQYVCDCTEPIWAGTASCNGTVGALDVKTFFAPFTPLSAVEWKWWE